MRERMLQSARQHDPKFPDGNEVKLTHFAYVGDVDANGEMLRVVAVRAVITGMLAPRGLNWLSFFDLRGNFVGRHEIDGGSPPLWCEGSRIYFVGLQGNGEEEGNVLDLRDGFKPRKYALAPSEGSWTKQNEADRLQSLYHP